MNSRKRVEKALRHEKTDRVPIDFGSTSVTGISASIVYKLREYFCLDNSIPVKIIEPYQMLGEITEDLREKLGADCVGLWRKKNNFGFKNENWKPWKLFDGTPVLVPGKFNTKVEKNGDVYQYPEGDISVLPSARMPKGGYYFDAIIRKLPIDDDKLNVEDNLEEFSIIDEEEIEYIEQQADYLYRNTGFAIMASFGGTGFGDIARVPGLQLKNPKGIRDIQEWYISLLTRKNYIYEVFARQCEIALENFKKIYQSVSNKISVVFISGTDFGTQRGLFISKDMYRELFKPFHRKINDWVHKNTNWKTFIHSCGAIEPLIPQFIDAGFDILNPVQLSAEGMDAVYLKKKYGNKIVFWGGGVDTQKTLPFGTSEEVKEQVDKRLKVFMEGGGFVFNAVHNIQAKTPIENIISMLDVVRGHL
jgi:hypothetical protein